MGAKPSPFAGRTIPVGILRERYFYLRLESHAIQEARLARVRPHYWRERVKLLGGDLQVGLMCITHRPSGGNTTAGKEPIRMLTQT